MSKLIDVISDFFFPNRCPFCDCFIPYDKFCCEKCMTEMEHGEFCIKCGHAVCECKSGGIIYDGCATVIPYTSRGREGILSLKYNSGFNTAKLLVPELSRKLENAGYLDCADMITAVPMTKKRRYQTGYNHAEYIAKLLSEKTGLPCDFKLIDKKKGAALQHELGYGDRVREAAEVYSAVPGRDISGRTVILCDDIITTGSTLNACAGVLKGMGAERVYCAVLAGTPAKETDRE